MAGLDDFALFVSIVEAGSLAAAARVAHLPKSSVSRRLAALEARLNKQLLQRSTRRLALTETGRELFERCRPLVADALAIEQEVLAQPGVPHGLLRVTATGAFGRHYAGPLLGEFLALHPLLNAELLLLDRPVHLIEEGFDLALCMAAATDPSLIQRKLGTVERVLCASPSYLACAKAITRLSDLAAHDCLTTVLDNRWTFLEAGRLVVGDGKHRLTTNQLEVIYAAAVQGSGIALLPRFLVGEDLLAGRLIALLTDTPPVDSVVRALWPDSRFMPAKTRRFIDFVASRLSEPGIWERPVIARGSVAQ
jgi:DNA-binding transcriptional LysR family regulator